MLLLTENRPAIYYVDGWRRPVAVIRGQRMISQNEIQKIVAHIREVAHPSHIYIFGSYANGTAREDSDLDIAVVKRDIINATDEIVAMKRGVISADYSIDILLFTEAEFFADKNHTSIVIDEIREHGKSVHAA